jgi:hypothetical protein
MKIILSLFLVLFSQQSFALQALESGDFAVIDKKVRELGQSYGASNVLVVYDLDNTLLAMNTDIGSDQWFDWQSSLLATPGNPDLVGADFNGVLKIQGLLYTIGSMHLTQNNLPVIYGDLKKDGYPQVLLTSRGPDFRDATEKEILGNGLGVWDPKATEQMFYGMPYDLSDLGKSCLNETDKTDFKLGNPRPISIGHNIILSSGQHKGMILKTWICQKRRTFKAIVFADDKQKNVDAMIAAFGADTNTELVTYRYSHEDARVKAFQAGDKAQAKRDWQDLFLTMSVLFGGPISVR